jgi:hypothetical protein
MGLELRISYLTGRYSITSAMAPSQTGLNFCPGWPKHRPATLCFLMSLGWHEHKTTPSYWLRLLGLAWKCNPPTLSLRCILGLPVSTSALRHWLWWDLANFLYRCEPPAPSNNSVLLKL